VLRLRLKKVFFDAIAKGEKKIEYRKDTPYWRARLAPDGCVKLFDEIWFTNGYNRDSPFLRVEHIANTRAKGEYFSLELGGVLEIKNWDGG